jgi:CHAT domain-containing protein/Tfp pilus assembly protein PilF
MRRVSPATWVVLAVLATGSAMLCLALPQPGDAPADRPIRELRPGVVYSLLLSRGAASRFAVALNRGQCLAAAIEQRGVDLVVDLYGPNGARLLTLDSPTGDRGRESVWHVAGESGSYVLAVRAFHPEKSGSYGIAVEPLRRATAEDRLRSAALASFASAEALRSRPTDRGEALRLYRKALDGWEQVKDTAGQSMALRRLGQVSFAAGDARAALGWYGRARQALAALDEDRSLVDLLLETGEAHRALGEARDAEECFRTAHAAARREGDRWGEAVALNNLGLLAQARSDARAAVEHYQAALAAWRAAGSREQEAVTLHNLGTVLSLLARHEEALATLHRALGLRRALGDVRGQAATWTAIGWVHYLTGQPRRALDCYQRALPLRRAAGDLLGEAATLDRQGTALRAVGELDAALAAYERVLAIVEQAGEPLSRAHALANLGEARLDRGDPETALRLAREALRVMSDGGDRHGAAHAEVIAGRAERELGHLDASQAAYERALATAEALRTEIRGTPFPLDFFASRHAYFEEYVDLLMERGEETKAFEAAERSRARGLVESVGARPGSVPGQPLDLAGIEREVLDDDTLLLEYALGRERSFLWMVGRGSLATFTLPPEAAIDALARRAAELAARSHQRGARQAAELALAALSDAVLAPALPLLDDDGPHRLIVVADGALLAVPLGALPIVRPDGETEPLLARRDVVYLPSASVLAQIRRAERRRPSRTLALVTDPRLPFVRREAATIQSLVSATRETVLSGRLGDYRILHFATHAVLDADHPERSGLALSHGLVGAEEIGGLELPAELVVLAACRTALGRPLRGEGLLGLGRAFLHAGSQRVMASLWDVGDEATAELMRRFYRQLFEERLPPAAALRQAQLSLRAEPRFRAPYYWAGFVLQGEIR